ncbi:MAG: AIR synthase-related protein, partial [Candidatus Acidiferrales bacterium]
GAAGLTCSTCEMAARSGTGIEIELDKVPQRETGMTPYEIMLSESQERMLVVAEKDRAPEVQEVFRKWGLDAVVIGQVTDDGVLRVRHHRQVVAEIPARPLADDCPVYQRPMQAPAAPSGKLISFVSDEEARRNLRDNFLRLLASPNLASRRWIYQQYDHMVRTNTVLHPERGDAAVLRLKGSRRGLALTVDGNGRWCRLDPQRGAQLAVAEAARNLVAVGARPLAVTNCLNFGNPEKPEIMGQFSAVIDGMAEACRVFGTPVTGGNVSFYNETRGQGIHPTPVIGMLGLLDNVERALGSGFRVTGSAIVLLGGKSGVEHAPEPAFSSSEYARLIYGVTGGEPPEIDLAYEKRVQDCVLEAHRRALLAAVHDISDGGLLVALAECCFAAEPARGVAVTLGGKQPLEAVLFGEEPSRLLLEVDEKQLAELLRLAREYQVEARQLGWTSAGEFRVHFNRQVVLEEDIATLREVWQAGLPQALQTVGSL